MSTNKPTTAAQKAIGEFAPKLADLPRAIENGVTREELVELIIQLAFYAGGPKAMSAW
jgi:4-carboxymuconolactone decarboxylase